MWEKLTPRQISERRTELLAQRARIDSDLAKLEVLERDIIELFGEGNQNHNTSGEDNIHSNTRFYFGTDAVLKIVREHNGLWRSQIITQLSNYNVSLSKNTVSTYLNRFSNEGKVRCIQGKWYGVKDE